MKILLNAEAFGFGPSAALSVIFHIIKDNFTHYQLDYIGQGHTLDLQSSLPYHNVFQYHSEDNFKNIVKNYDFFITALDIEKAQFAKSVGTITIVYDTLLWYWKDTSIIKHADYYITQNFYGVTDLISHIKENNSPIVSYIIPPLIEKKDITQKCEDFLLVNFGGLENPYWSIEITVSYIKKILTVLLPIVTPKFKKIKIVCSKNHIHYLKDFPLDTASYKEMQLFLQKASYIIATSGLGNIYEIANYQVPSLFLPPVNDSQGQQLDILKKEGLIDNHLDWKEFQSPINYFNNQKQVLEDIEIGIENFNSLAFSQQLENKLSNKGNMKMYSLFDLFGLNGKIQLEEVLINILK